MTRGPGWRKCTAYRQPGPRGTPLGLGLNEGLGISVLSEANKWSVPLAMLNLVTGARSNPLRADQAGRPLTCLPRLPKEERRLGAAHGGRPDELTERTLFPWSQPLPAKR